MPFLVSFSFVRSVDFDADRVRCSRIAEVVFGNDRDGSAVIGASESRVLDQLIELANRQPVYVVRESLSHRRFHSSACRLPIIVSEQVLEARALHGMPLAHQNLAGLGIDHYFGVPPVSYTHLTLPTIYSV